MKPLISIVLCTYNNADSLDITLQQLAEIVHGESKLLEVIVVNNNSPDNTACIAQKYSGQNPLFHYYFEPRQGLSHARNTGLEKARGEYILFTDDDAEIPNNWVSEYMRTIAQYSPDCLYSRITIIWDKPKPWWFIPEYTPYFVGLNYGDQVLEVTDIHREFYGKNFCVRKSLITQLGGFDPNLGRQGAKLAAGEETLLYRKMVQQGKKIIYFPSAAVGHRLKVREYSSDNIKKLFVDGAHSSHHIAKISARKKIMGRPARMLMNSLRDLCLSSVQYLLTLTNKDKAKNYYHYLCACRSIMLIKLWMKNP